jgi:hypothetical protein
MQEARHPMFTLDLVFFHADDKHADIIVNHPTKVVGTRKSIQKTSRVGLFAEY